VSMFDLTLLDYLLALLTLLIPVLK